MAKKLSYRNIGMDVMERLYYERKEARQKAYIAKRKKEYLQKFQMKLDSDVFDGRSKQAICNMY